MDHVRRAVKRRDHTHPNIQVNRALYWHLEEPMFVLGLDGDCTHGIIVGISLDLRLDGSRIHMS
jgi:hypothetical protein